MLLEIAKAPDEDAMNRLVYEIVANALDRAAVHERRAALANGQGADEQASSKPAAPKPFTIRFRNPDRTFSLSLSFRTEREPEPREVIEALREVIREIESSLE